jgi:hypothetical protein
MEIAMNAINPVSGNAPGLPSGAKERLALFAEWTGTTPPANITQGKGEDLTFHSDLLAYARRNGLNLDWFWLGDERGLVLAYHRRELVKSLGADEATPTLQIPKDVGEFCRKVALVLASSHAFLEERINQYAAWAEADGETEYDISFSPDEIGRTRDNLAKATETFNWLAAHGDHGQPVKAVDQGGAA